MSNAAAASAGGGGVITEKEFEKIKEENVKLKAELDQFKNPALVATFNHEIDEAEFNDMFEEAHKKKPEAGAFAKFVNRVHGSSFTAASEMFWGYISEIIEGMDNDEDEEEEDDGSVHTTCCVKCEKSFAFSEPVSMADYLANKHEQMCPDCSHSKPEEAEESHVVPPVPVPSKKERDEALLEHALSTITNPSFTAAELGRK